MRKAILLIVVIIALGSCKKVRMRPCPDCFFFYFESPQPDNDVELDRFPHKFRGIYKNEDSTFLKIDEDRIIATYFAKYKIHKSEIDSMKSDYLIFKNKIIRKDSKQSIYMSSKGDSLELTEVYLDTIFRFSYNQKVKRINGQLILSTRDSIFWDIEFLSLEKNRLKFKNIYLPDDLKKLDSVTSIKAKMIDSMSYLIKPTRKEFKNILKIKNLGYDQEYKKVSN